MSPVLKKVKNAFMNQFKIERKNNLAFPLVHLSMDVLRQPFKNRRRVDFFILLCHEKARVADIDAALQVELAAFGCFHKRIDEVNVQEKSLSFEFEVDTFAVHCLQ
jgi:hypothetical protein